MAEIQHNNPKGDVVTVEMGNRNTLGNCNTLGDGNTLGDEVQIGNNVTIGNGVTIGNMCVVDSGVTILDGMNIPAGSRVSYDKDKGFAVRLMEREELENCYPALNHHDIDALLALRGEQEGKETDGESGVSDAAARRAASQQHAENSR